MNAKNELPHSLHYRSFSKHALQGVIEFLPLVIATLGGMVYYLTVQVWYPNGWEKFSYYPQYIVLYPITVAQSGCWI